MAKVYKEITKDAEDVKVKNNKIISIGEKIKKRFTSNIFRKI